MNKEISVGTSPFSLSIDGIDPPSTSLAMQPPTDSNELGGMNAVQAIRHSQSKIADTATFKQEDCWLLHAYLDIHQPLHTTVVFAKTLLPKGCGGGNSIKTKQGWNLHSLCAW
ncbi:hypothetical protein N9B60_04540 [Mariniblastus sp.]|nr:hypothetical protein [Mariniblastus sp.]